MSNFSPSRQRPDRPSFGETVPWSRRGVALILVAVLVGWTPFSGVLRANPSGGAVRAGQATINGGAGRLTVKQTSPTAIIHWQDFSVGLGETTQFIQPNASSAALNRVVGGNPSAIYGTLQANGQIYLINPNGVLVGASGVINTAGFLASTLDVTDEAFEARGDLTFRGDSSASVVNLGTIGASEGDVILIARTVENHGTIQAARGTVALAAGNEVLVKASGEERVFVRPEGSSGSRVSQAGLIEAATVELKAAGGNEYALAIKHSGVTRATGVVKRGGRIMLSAGGKGGISNSGRLVARKSSGEGGEVRVKAGGNVANDGIIDAAGTKGGRVEIEAERASHTGLIIADGSVGSGGSVTVTTRDGYHDTRSATISARGALDGGTIRVESTEVGARIYSSSTMDAGSLGGLGGSIVVTSDELYLMGSRLIADGAAGGGEIFAGGGIQGHNAEVANATTLYVNQTSLFTANATSQGDGGTVVLWAEGTTQFLGQIEARGGVLGGDGGFLEVSGKESTRFGGFATAEAPMGQAGTLLLDPKNIIVDAVASGGNPILFEFVDPNKATGNGFGESTVALITGNVAITATGDDFGGANAGAAYLFDGSDGTLISTLRGSAANDRVGLGGITALSNGNYVVRSSSWDNGASTDAGAVTWGSGTLGISGVVSAVNSLVGSTANDRVGNNGITALSNGNYVVRSLYWDNGAVVDAGAATWGNGLSGIAGTISASNSILGGSASANLSAIVTDDVNGTFIARFMSDTSGGAGGRAYAGSSNGPGLTSGFLFSNNPADNITITAATITAITNTGTAVILQANNDITVNTAITSNNASGNGGDLTFQAGRSILLNANITTDNGNLTLVANETLANGVIDAHRDAGPAVIFMAGGTSIDAGTGTVSLTLANGAGKTNLDSGVITLRNISAGSIAVANLGTGTDADLSLNGAFAAGSGPIGLIANRSIVGNSGSTLTAQNQAIILNSDRDVSGGGNIQLTNTTITSNGGAITLGGGLNPLTTAAIGMGIGSPQQKAGIYLSNGALNSGAGAISLLGQGVDGTSAAYGIAAAGAVVESTGSGTVTLNGTGGAGTTYNYGVHLTGSNTKVRAEKGALSITGVGGAGSGVGNHGINVDGGARVESTGLAADAATLTLHGTGGASSTSHGVNTGGATTMIRSGYGDIGITGLGGATGGTSGIARRGVYLSGGSSIISDGSGADAATITITGTGGAGTGQDQGVYLNNGKVRSVDGDISITGTAVTASHGLFFYSGSEIQATGGADIHLIGQGPAGDLTLYRTALTPVNKLISHTGDIIIEANTWNSDVFNTDGLNADFIESTGGAAAGRLIIRPRTAGTTIGIGGAGVGTLSLNDTRLGFIQDGFSEIIIGSATAGNTTVNAATFTDNLRLITGGTLAINGVLSTGANRLALIIGGDTTQAASLTAGSLRLGGNGNFTLLNAANNIATLSKDRTGSLAYMDADSFAIATVDGINGLVGSSMDLRANTNITATATSITTTGGTIILNSDRDATGGGNIQLTGTTISSNGGEIILSGGGGDASALRSTGVAVGSGTGSPAEKAGIYLSASTLISDAGAITLRGEGIAGTDSAYGIHAVAGSMIGSATGSGAIALHGSGGAGTINNVGIHLTGTNTAVRSADGAILISGRGMGSGGNNHGILLSGGAVVESTGIGAGASTMILNGTGATGSGANYGTYLTGANTAVRSKEGDIAITGTGGDAGGSNYGIVLTQGGVVESTGTGAGAATLNLTGTGGNGSGGNHGFYLRQDAASRIKSIDGAITLTGLGQGSSGNGIHFAGNFQVETSGSAPLTLTATGAGTSADLAAITTVNSLGGATATGNITLNADTIDWGASLMTLQSKGTLLIQPRTPTTTIGLGDSAAGRLNLAAAELSGIKDGFAEIIIGNATAGNTIVNAATFTDNLRLITGGTLAINGALSAGANRLALIIGGNTSQTAALTAGSLRLGGNGDFTLLNGGNNTATLAKDGSGSLAYMDLDSVAIGTVDGVNGLVGSRVEVRANTNITATNTSITTPGGTIILNADRDGVGRGNIQLSGTTIVSHGGNIVLGGGTDPMTNAAVSFSTGSTANNRGIYLSNSTIRSGTGDISMRGKGNDGDSGSRGIELSGSTVESTTGSVTMHGEGGAFVGSQQAGVSLVTSTVASDSGSINLTAFGGSGGNSMALLFWNGAEVLSRDNGTIILTGAGTGSGVDLYSDRSVGGTAVSKIGNHGDPAKAGNIVLNINTTNWASANTSFQSDGTLTIQPRTAGTTVGIGGGSGTLNLSLDRLSAIKDGFSEIIIGSTDAGNITANAATFTDNLRLITAGNLSINGALNTGANQLALIVGGNTTQAAALTAGSLRLGGNGNFTLLNAANNIATLAKDGTGSVSLRHGSSLTLGTVDGVNGVSGSTIDLRTEVGNLTLSQAVTGSATGNAVVLSTPGAFINNVGASAVSTPNGRWLIYTAAPAGNTYGGLLSGNQALYNRTYTGNPPAGITESGNRYLFANQPTLTFTSTSDSKTYGDDFTVAIADNFTVSGFVDAATYGNVFTQDTLATITSGTAVTSSAGAATTASVAGSPYSVLLDLTGVTATTGYTLSKAETGQLTVGQKALTVTANNQSKTYGDTFTFAGTEFGTNGLMNGDTVTSATIGSAGAINTATVAGSSYGITISGATGSGLENYSISYVDGSLTLNKRDITVTALGGTSTYGDSPGNPGLSATNLATFDTVAALTGLSNSFGINSTTNAGNHVLTVAGTLGNGNYNITSRLNGNWSVAQKSLTVTANNQRKVYGQGFTFAGTEFRSTGLINGDKVSGASLTSSGATKTASVAGGPYLVAVGSATGTGLGNYEITYRTGLLTVTTAPLSIVANNASRALNQPNPTFTATISGFVLGEKLGSLLGNLQFSTLALPGSPLGSYDIIPFGVTSTNYEITFTPGTLTVGSPVENPLMTRTEHADAEKLMKDDFEKDGDESFKVIYESRSYPGSITTLSSGEVP